MVFAAGPGDISDEDFSCDGLTRASVGVAEGGDDTRIVCADIVALDQTLVYNRFGSFNPFGMIFALRRDTAPLGEADLIDPDLTEIVVPDVAPLTREGCDMITGTEAGPGSLDAGLVRLRDCKRPRPIVLPGGGGRRHGCPCHEPSETRAGGHRWQGRRHRDGGRFLA